MPSYFYYTIGIFVGSLGWMVALIILLASILLAILSKWIFLFCLTFIPIVVALTQTVVDWTIEKEQTARQIEWEKLRASE